ncbi:hypothetical protein ABZ543_08140 [Streptomyces roseifaciens]
MKLPRVDCSSCGRAIAARPVADRISKGRVWRHDPPGMRRRTGGDLVSCSGSLAIVDMPLPGQQLTLDDTEPILDATEDQPALFVI